MQIIVKKAAPRVDPERPWTRPGYEKALKVAERRLPKMEAAFKSEGERSDYYRAVRGNPENIPGLPAFFPAVQIKSYLGEVMGREYTAEEQSRVESERIRVLQIRVLDLFCGVCDSLQMHAVGPQHSFCQKCGTQKPWRT